MEDPNKPILTPKQELFCHEYVKTRNGTRAAIAAGYSKDTAQEQASRLLSNVMVRTKVNELIKDQLNRLKIKSDFVVRELLNTATVDIVDAYDEDNNLLPIKDMSEPLRKAITHIDSTELYEGTGKDRKNVGQLKTIKIHDRLKSLEMLGRHLKMFTDVHQIPGLEQLAEEIKAARKRAERAEKCRQERT